MMPKNPITEIENDKAMSTFGVLGPYDLAIVPLVLTITVTGDELALGVSEAGFTVQLADIGAPLHVKFTRLEKLPPIENTFSV